MSTKELDLFGDDILNNEEKLPHSAPLAIEERTRIEDTFEENNTSHEAVVPLSITEYTPINHTPQCSAKTYKFSLDTFQALSISAIEADRSVLVSAHTSCGKTVVAEYAIAQSILNKQRVIYTSPIKALSNQKFRELQEEFQDVGLMTGDVTLNPEATCIVMTTEILRNMLYRGSEIVREIHWIIFDEIHYLKDKERGVVWEETIILLPSHVRMIFLSATIPNAQEFAEWVAHTSQQIVHVIYTQQRVIPLVHYFYSADDTLREIKNKDGKFNADEFMASQNKTIVRKEIEQHLTRLLENINVPAVVFSFARASCEHFATKLTRDFLTKEEKNAVRTIFTNAISSLNETDQKLPAVAGILPLFERGIGVHHSGLLPIIKEISEILFQESLIKVLFATETFSIGLNMPAKTVVFTSIKKYDGQSERILTSGEYTQMSGRAGRRGLDSEGIVVSLVTDKLASKSVADMLNKGSDRLTSAFRLTYNTILNLMRMEGLDPLYLLSKSFYHFQAYKKAMTLQNEILSEAKDNLPATSKKNCSLEAPQNEKTLANMLIKNENLLIKRNKQIASVFCEHIKTTHRVVDIMIPRCGLPLIIKNCIIKEWCSKKDNDYITVFLRTSEDVETREFPIDYVCNVYDFRAKIEEKAFTKKFPLLQYSTEIDKEISEGKKEIYKKFKIPKETEDTCMICNRNVPECLFINDVDGEMKNYLTTYSQCLSRHKIVSNNSIDASHHNNLLNIAIEGCINKIYTVIHEERLASLDALKEIYHMEECKKMVNVLRQLGHLDGDTCTLKGKMASEISSGDEILLTEMIFSSGFSELSLLDMLSLLSIVITERSKEGLDAVLSEENQKLVDGILSPSIKIVEKVVNDCGFNNVTEGSYYETNNYNFYMMDIVRMWASGYSFFDICNSTSVYEGSIIRGFKRLEELLRQLGNAASVIGNQDLVNLFGQGIYLIKRDIVFANSLYL